MSSKEKHFLFTKCLFFLFWKQFLLSGKIRSAENSDFFQVIHLHYSQYPFIFLMMVSIDLWRAAIGNFNCHKRVTRCVSFSKNVNSSHFLSMMLYYVVNFYVSSLPWWYSVESETKEIKTKLSFYLSLEPQQHLGS